VFPVVEKMQRDERAGKSSRSDALLTSCCACSRRTGTALHRADPGASPVRILLPPDTVLTLTTGGVFVMWLGEQIRRRIGNGASLLIFSRS